MNREIKLSAMNCHHRFYTLESFFANAKSKWVTPVLNYGRDHNISTWTIMVMKQ